MKIHWPWTIALLLLFIALGALRQVVFDLINAQIGLYTGVSLVFPLPTNIDYMSNFSLDQLTKGKWLFTLGFMLVNFGLSCLALIAALKRPDALKWLAGLFGLGFILAAAFFLGGKLIGQGEVGYSLARTFMGALQSPFPLMMIIPALFLQLEGE